MQKHASFTYRRVVGCIFIIGCIAALSLRGHTTGDASGTVATPTQRLAHTLEIIRTASTEHPHVLKLLFYGQSISSTKWTDRAVEHLRADYPNVRFEVSNLAIGGFDSRMLERTVERDIAEIYPDLVVFHAYGDHRAYEAIIHAIRSLTAADIILQTDHVVTPPEPVCDEGFHLVLSVPPGCQGLLWHRQTHWDDYMSGKIIPELADKYGLVVEPRRVIWNSFLKQNKLKPEALLADPPHPNDQGWSLMADIFEGNLHKLIATWNQEAENTVSTIPIPDAAGNHVIHFSGNRVELIANQPLDGKVNITIDNLKPKDIDGCWQTTRASAAPIVTDWPAIRQISVAKNFHQEENWTATISHSNPEANSFHFTLAGSETGEDGEGDVGHDFVSPSGRIRIAGADWVLTDELKLKGKSAAPGFQIHWSQKFVCGDQSPVQPNSASLGSLHLAATGLKNEPHVMKIELSQAASAIIYQIRAYQPPLKKNL